MVPVIFSYANQGTTYYMIPLSLIHMNYMTKPFAVLWSIWKERIERILKGAYGIRG